MPFVPAVIRLAFLALLCCYGPILSAQRENPAGAPESPCHRPFHCDTLRPVVFVHGFMASGDSWRAFSLFFQNDGYCAERLFAFDWNTLDQLHDHSKSLGAFIDTVLARTGARQVDLFGHSMGGNLCYNYLKKPENAAKVAHYVHLASMQEQAPAGPSSAQVPTLNVWSDADYVVKTDSIPGAQNLRLKTLDHYQLATDSSVYQAAFRFIQGATAWPMPAVDFKKLAHTTLQLRCRVVVFGSNKAVDNATVTVYQRGAKQPIAVLKSGPDGYLPPIIRDSALLNAEFVVQVPDQRDLHYYFHGLHGNEPFVYLRSLPDPISPLGFLLGGLPKSEDACVINLFSSSRSLIAGRDQVGIDTFRLINSGTAPPEKTAISFFLYDDNKNGKSDLTTIARFRQFPFLAGVDFNAGPIEPPNPEPQTGKKRTKASDSRERLLVPGAWKPYLTVWTARGAEFMVPRIPASEGIMIFVLDL